MFKFLKCQYSSLEPSKLHLKIKQRNRKYLNARLTLKLNENSQNINNTARRTLKPDLIEF